MYADFCMTLTKSEEKSDTPLLPSGAADISTPPAHAAHLGGMPIVGCRVADSC